MDKYPKSEGVLFVNKDKTNEKHPDFRGKIEVTKEQIQKLIKMGKAGLEPIIQVAAWDRVSKANTQYFYLGTEVYMKEDAGEVVAAARPEPAPAKPEWDDDDFPF